RNIVEDVRTPGLAAAAVAFSSMAMGLAALVVRSLALKGFNTLRAGTDQPGPLMRRVSPILVTAAVVVAVALGLFLVRRRVIAIMNTLDLTPWLIVTAALVAAAGVSLARPVASWSNRARRAVIALPPTVSLVCLVASLVFMGSGNATRIALTTKGRLSPAAYRMVKKVLDFDGDGQLSMMGEGDCAPFDSRRFAAAPEVPNNGIDEDCDGKDLELRFDEKTSKQRWDYKVPDGTPAARYVVLITLDAVSMSSTSIMGGARQTTPHLQDLARDSAVFTSAFSQGPSTRLSFPAMFTSKYDSQIKRRKAARIPLEILKSNVMMAEVLHSAGFYSIAVLPTAYFKNWKGLTQGFDQVMTQPVKSYRKPIWHNAAQVTDAALDAIEGNEQEKVFLWVHYYDTHSPYTKPPGGPDFGKSNRDIHDAELANTDQEAARLIEGIRKAVPEEHTLLIVTADHGEAFDGSHPRKHHGHDLHAQVLNVPMIINAPFLRGRVIDTPVSTLDILPTIVNLTGIRGEYGFEGQSLVPFLFDAPPDRNRLVFSQYFLPENVYHKKRTLRQVSVISDSLHLILDLAHNTRMLYKFRDDPLERDNLAEKMPEAVAILKKQVTAWMARVARR
ncbi:MAG: sulfatase-like hydrolase/transferase, partial [Deltaproteobacteria bacterium]|nr:sulfatase-like hydrolase/transferase [Deltaproteobacteria bacterium]